MRISLYSSFFFFNAPATTELYTLSLHDALPISGELALGFGVQHLRTGATAMIAAAADDDWLFIDMEHGAISLDDATQRSEEHTSELQSLRHLVCRLLLEKKKTKNKNLTQQKRNK